MGEEDKKPEDTKPEEPSKVASDEEKKDAENPPEKKEHVPPPPQAQDIVLTVFMHCEGCARKVRRCLKDFEGVESVETDCRSHRVVVKGEKADPLKILGRLQRKCHRRVELISPIPIPIPIPIPQPPLSNPEPIHKPKTEDKKPQSQVITVILKVHMHCEACAQEIKKRIHRMKGVESVDPDLKCSQVTVKGAIDPAALVEYVHRRTGKHMAIVKQEPEIMPEINSEDVAKEDKEEKKVGGGEGVENENKVDEESKVKEKAVVAAVDREVEGAVDLAKEEALKVVEVKKNEYNCYPQRYIMEMYPYPPPMIGSMAYPLPHMVVEAYPPPVIGHAYPPQMFSDENPNACSII